MRHIIFILTLVIATSLHAQDVIKKVIVENYYISDNKDATDTTGGILQAGSTTYRIYVQLQKGYKLSAIYGDANHALKISSTANFFNNVDRGKTFGKDIVKSFLANNTAALDSWITIGQATTKKNGMTYFGVLKSQDKNGSFIGGSNNDGGSASVPGGLLTNNDPLSGIPVTIADGLDTMMNNPANWINNGFLDMITGVDSTIFGSVKPGSEYASNNAILETSGVSGIDPDSNQVLVAQLTTKGEISFELNIVVLSPDGTPTKYVAKRSADSLDVKFSGWLKYPFNCGCKDPNYLEYNPDYPVSVKDSCKRRIVIGCMDPDACNYDPNANYSLPSLCCYPGMCADRDISLVCPDLGSTPLKVRLYPNPAEYKLNVDISKVNSENVLMSIYDMYGNKFLENTVNNNSNNITQEIDLSTFTKGIYYVRIQNNEGVNITKFFVKK